MLKVFRHLLRAVWTGIAIALILAAALTVISRRLLPLLPDYRAQIETLASKELHHPVRIGQIQVGWHGFTPIVTLGNVSILDVSGNTSLKLSRIGLRLGIWNSLLARQLVPDRISIDGAHLLVIRQQNGRLSIGGVPLLASISTREGAHLPTWLVHVSYRLSHADILFEDQRGHWHDLISNVSLIAQPSRAGITLAGGFSPPERLGRRVSFAGVLHREKRNSAFLWQGEFYVDLQAIRLDELPFKVWLPRMPPLKGQLSARLWANWSAGQLTRIVGHLSVHHLGVGTGKTADSAGVTDLSADLRWQAMAGGWRLQGTQVQVVAGSSQWPADAFEFKSWHKNGHHHIGGWVNFLRLQNLTPILVQLPSLSQRWSDRLALLAPSGELKDLRFNLKTAPHLAPELALSSGLSDIALHANHRQPGLSGLSGSLALRRDRGSLSINSPDLILVAPDVFGRPLPAVQTIGTFAWQRDARGYEIVAPHFEASNQDFALQGQLGLWLPSHGSPWMNLMLGIKQANVAATPRYLPLKRLHPDVVHWLDKALKGGMVTSGGLILRGDLGDFPFRDHRGMFDVLLNIRNGTLDYFRNWPEISAMRGELGFHDYSLHAHVLKASLLATRLSNVQVDIPDLENAVVGIHGSGQGPLGDVATYLAYTPLGEGRKALFDEIKADGQTKFSLKLNLPIKKADLHRWTLSGQAQVERGRFALPNQDFALKQINGHLDFTKRSLAAHEVKAIFRGVPVVLGASTRKDGLATLTLDGHLSVGRLFGPHSPVARYAHGDTDWRMLLSLPMTKPTYRRYGMGLTLVSGLRGVAIALPHPIGKPASQDRGLVVAHSLTRPDAPFYIRYGRDVQALFQLSGKTGCERLMSGDLRLDAGAPRLPSDGFDIEGHLVWLDADAWRSIWSKRPVTPPSVSCPTGSGISAGRLHRLDLSVGDLNIFGRRLHKVHVVVNRQKDDWHTRVSSDVLDGTLQVPVALHGGRAIRFDLSRLDLDHSSTRVHQGPATLNPTTLPPLSGRIGELLVDGRVLHHLQLATKPVHEGMQIHLVRLDEPHLHARASGVWQRVSQGHTRMQIQLEVDTDDAGKALDEFNVPAGLAGGKGHLSAMLDWPGGPSQLSWGVLKGHAQFNLKNGRLMEVNPGQAGRLLGLLNLAALPQRLSLNFGDVFDKGFVFNNMSSQFQLRGGNLYTQDTHIAGSAADVSITGRVGMVARDYDAQVTIIPQVQSTVAIAGAVIGGPVTGAALFLLDRILGIGKQIDKAAAFRYHVSGSWQAPKIQAEDDAAKPSVSKSRKRPWKSPF